MPGYRWQSTGIYRCQRTTSCCPEIPLSALLSEIMSLLLAVNLTLWFSGVVGVHATESLVENKLSSKGAILARESAWLVKDQVILLANSALFSTNALDFSRFQRNTTTILGLF